MTGDSPAEAGRSGTVRYHIILGKKDEIVVGPDDPDVEVMIGKADCGLDPNVAYMQGRLKATGHTGVLFDALQSGAAAEVLQAHA
ncbi:MAG TPA: hypothetical protein VF076_07625 [Acidimicrobiales bacterium]